MSGAHMLASCKAAARAGLRAVIDVIAPPNCLVCRERVLEPAALCPQCWKKITFIEAPCCDRLGIPFAYDQGDGALSAAAIADPPVWDRARSATAFNATSRELVHALKYQDRHEAALLMSRLMLRAAKPLLDGADAIVPVPLHRRRLWFRRYNQSALLAQRLAHGSGLTISARNADTGARYAAAGRPRPCPTPEECAPCVCGARGLQRPNLAASTFCWSTTS